jgi:hypothetical protein
MNENEYLVDLINKDIGSLEDTMMIPAGMGLEMPLIREKLAYLIAYLMQNHFEKLCQAMYRLDVSEKKFDEAMHQAELAEIPYVLADLVIEREMQKIRTRILYKKGEL